MAQEGKVSQGTISLLEHFPNRCRPKEHARLAFSSKRRPYVFATKFIWIAQVC